MPRRLHQYINSHHPGYLRRLAFASANFGTRVYQEYRALRAVTRDRSTTMPPSRYFGNRARAGASPYTPQSRAQRARGPNRFIGPRMRNGRRYARTGRVLNFTGNGGGRFRRGRRDFMRRIGLPVRHRVTPFQLYTGQGRRWRRMQRKKVVPSVFYGRKGAVAMKEYRGTLEDADCVYIGHGMSGDLLALTVARALVKALYIRTGWEIPSWEESVPFSGSDTHFLQLEYFTTPTSFSAILINTVNIGTGSTWDQIADLVRGLLTTASNPDTKYQSLSLYDGSNVGADRVMLSKIMLQRLDLRIKYTSFLKVQNATFAASGTEAEDEDAENVRANPLVGKHYGSHEWRNGFELHWRPGATNTDWPGFYANPDTGAIQVKAADAQSGSLNTFDKPPPYFQFVATKGTGVRLDPGEIQTSQIKFETRIMFQNLMKKTWQAFLNYASSTPFCMEFGFAKMLGLEKLLDTGAATDASLVSVGWQVDSTVSVATVLIPSSTLPRMEIG